MANEQNLRTPTTEQAREIGRLGGLASQKKNKERKSVREAAQLALGLFIGKGDIASLDEIVEVVEAKGKKLTVLDAAMIQQSIKASKGDEKATRFLIECAGEAPSNHIDITANSIPVVIKDDVAE